MSSRKPNPKAGTVSQRQLRASEMIRHALVEVMRENEIRDPALVGVSVTVTEVRMSPDLRHAVCFIQPLGGENAPEVVAAMNRASKAGLSVAPTPASHPIPLIRRR